MNGLLLLDKRPGCSSHEALAPVKRALGRKVRVGHAGTLDPFATGLLLVLCGDATRLAEVASMLQKTYEGTVRFGEETDTLDPDGAVVRSADPGAAPPANLREAFSALMGEISQVPPVHSAVKVEGRRAYELARAGAAPNLEPRIVRVASFDVVSVDWPNVGFRVTCGTGTYVRALTRDVGSRVGLFAHLKELRRTAIGPFTADAALAIAPGTTIGAAEIARHIIAPVDLTRAAELPERHLDRAAAEDFAHGRTCLPIRGRCAAGAPGTRVAVVFEAHLLGLGDLRPDGAIEPKRVLAHAAAQVLVS